MNFRTGWSFCQRFCYSLLKNKHTCSYISTQFTIKRFLRQTASVYLAMD
jgi:archaellum biogenesis ATPase FlaH